MAKKEPQYIALRDFTFSRGGERVLVTEGDECPKLGEGRIPQLLRWGWIVPADEFVPQPRDDEDTEVDEEPSDWRNTPIAKLDVDTTIRKALAKAGFTTVGALVAFGAEHGTLTEIDGIGEASEKALQEAIAKLAQ